MQYHVEGGDAHSELAGGVVARALFQHAQANRQRVTRIDPAEQRFGALAGDREVVAFERSSVACVAFRAVELAFDVVRFEHDLALAPPQLIERDAHGDDAQPRVDADVLPLELREPFDHAHVRRAERLLGCLSVTQTRQEHASEEPGSVRPQDRAERLPVATLGAFAERSFGLELGRQCRLHGGHCRPARFGLLRPRGTRTATLLGCRGNGHREIQTRHENAEVGTGGVCAGGVDGERGDVHEHETRAGSESLRSAALARPAPAAQRGAKMASGSRVCPHCGALNAIDDKECYRCKKRLPGRVGASLGAVRGMLGEASPMTYFFVLLCVVVYFLMTFVVSPSGDARALVNRLWQLPNVAYVRWGALLYTPPFPAGLGRMEPSRFVAAMFVHMGVLHIIFNTSGLLYYGRAVEDRIGSARFTIAFFVTGVLGFLASDVWYVATGAIAISAGASGGIFGLIGVLVGYLFAKRDPEYKQQLGYAVVMALVVGLVWNVNNAAHVGGFVAGLPLGWLFFKERRPDRLRPVMRALAVLAVLASLASLVVVQRSPWWRIMAQASESER